MDSFIALLITLSLGIVLRTHDVTAGYYNETSRGSHQTKNRPGKRNTKFIIPALISHMYRQKLDDSPLSTMLNKPFAKRVGKQDDRKRESEGVEHRTIVGNPKRDEHVRTVPKTRSPVVKTKESQVTFEVRDKEETNRDTGRHSGASSGVNINREGNVIQVSKHFSPLSRNWYANPSMMWPPPVPYPNSYGMPMDPRFSRPMYPGSFGQQEGFIQHIMGPTRNKLLANNLKEDPSNKNLVAQERKFVVTNITKYVLDFYCPHCGGEISVSKNRNKGGIFGTDQGAISINKGIKLPNESKGTTTPFLPKEVKTQQRKK